MTQEITTISPLFSTPYITVAEFKQAPTSVDVDDLVGGGSATLNDVELANVIARASSWMDSHCGQVLAATTDTESFRARISRDGFLKVHPRYWPVVALESLSYGANPQLMTAVDPTICWIEQESVVVPLQTSTGSFVGPIQFGGQYLPNAEQFVTMTYVNGYANTVNTSSMLAGVTSVPVKDATGFIPGQQFQIYDGVNSEILKVASSWTPTTGAANLAIASATAYTHNSGVSVSALPPAIKQAAIFATSAILKARGNAALVMGQLTPATIQQSNPSAAQDWDRCVDILQPFRRIR